MVIKPHHRRTAREFKVWLLDHSSVQHREIFDTFDAIADRNYRVAKREALRRKQLTQ